MVSVIVATRNRAALLGRALDALSRQDWPAGRFEIVVADNGSTDGTAVTVQTAARMDHAPPIRYLHVAEPGKSAAVNAALAHASGGLIAFTDDDVRPAPEWIARLAGAFDRTGADFAAGRILPEWEEPPPAWLSPALYGVLAIPDNGTSALDIGDGSGAAVIPIGANMAVRRHVVERLGGLHTGLGKLEGTLRTGEDHEFYLRMRAAGYRGVYEPAALVWHLVPADRLVPSYFFRWLHQNGRDVARLERAYPPDVRRWLGVPRYRWREAAIDLWRAVAAAFAFDARRRIAATGRVCWFGGYLREAWLGAGAAPAGVARLAPQR
jgi:glycosyltransferase involved in cell wall biosynthesis